MSAAEARIVRDKLNRALRKDKRDQALELYGELMALEPKEPRWPHRKGDLLHRLERDQKAIACYELAIDLYAALGFVARAVAMAKVVLGIDPSRMEVLQRVDPEEALRVQRRTGRSAPVVRRIPTGAPPPPPGAASFDKVTPGFQSLRPADDADEDEVRFEDGKSIDLDLSELEILEREESLPEFFLDYVDSEPTPEQLAKLPAMPVFAELPKEELIGLGKDAELVQLEDASPVVRTGAPADSLYVIVEGAVRVNVPGTGSEDDATLVEGDVFGEACLLDDVTRKADVWARGSLTALRIPKETIDRLIAAHPAFGEVMFELFTRRVVANLLRTSELFAAFDPETRREVARLFEARRAEKDQVVIEAGKRSDGLYVLLAGRVELALSDGSTRELSPVTMVGQSSLISHQAADFSVRTLTDALFLRLPAKGFGRLAALYPTVLMQIADMATRPVAPAVDAG